MFLSTYYGKATWKVSNYQAKTSQSARRTPGAVGYARPLGEPDACAPLSIDTDWGWRSALPGAGTSRRAEAPVDQNSLAGTRKPGRIPNPEVDHSREHRLCQVLTSIDVLADHNFESRALKLGGR